MCTCHRPGPETCPEGERLLALHRMAWGEWVEHSKSPSAYVVETARRNLEDTKAAWMEHRTSNQARTG